MQRLSPGQRQMRVLGVLTLLLLLGFAALGLLNAPTTGGGAIDLELARTAASFAQTARAHWLENDPGRCTLNPQPSPNGDSLMTLRCNLFADSVLFVPGYTGLLVFFTLALTWALGWRGPPPTHPENRRQSWRAAWRSVRVDLLCTVPVATAFFDLAENGMTAQAGFDWLHSVLADATVLDARAASLTKWELAAASFVLVGGLAALLSARAKARGDRLILIVAAALALLTAAALVAGTWWRHVLLQPGFVGGIATLVALSVWLIRDVRARDALVLQRS